MIRVTAISFFSCCLSSLLGSSEALTTMSKTEADRIVAQVEAEKLTKTQNRILQLGKAEVISEGRSTLPDGRTVIIREVVPPPVASEAQEQRPTTAPTAAEIEQVISMRKSALKPEKVIMLSCSIYEGGITEVRWTHEGIPCLAYTNANFDYLRNVSSLETEESRFTYFMGIGSAANAATLPELPAFPKGPSSYFLLQGSDESAIGLNVLLDYYDANLESLKIETQHRLALAEAKKRYREKNPEVPEDFIIQFWVPESATGDGADE